MVTALEQQQQQQYLNVIVLEEAIQERDGFEFEARNWIVVGAQRSHLLNTGVQWCTLPEGGFGRRSTRYTY